MTFKIAIFIFNFFISFHAFSKDCIDYQNQKVCVGDRATALTSDGDIVGVSKTKISIDFTNSSTSGPRGKKGTMTFDLSEVFFTGCLEDICSLKMGVGINDYGEIVGINPSSKKIAIKLELKKGKYSQIKIFDFKDVTMKEGCLGKYCIGDAVTYKNYDGVIVGINLKAKKVSINFAGGSSQYRGIGTYALETIGIGKGCLNGLCVGDVVVCRELKGSVIALNPFMGTVYVQNKMIQYDQIKNVTISSFNPNIDKENPLRK